MDAEGKAIMVAVIMRYPRDWTEQPFGNGLQFLGGRLARGFKICPRFYMGFGGYDGGSGVF